MMKTTRPASRGLRQGLALGSLTLLAVALLSGCGAENATPKTPNTNPTAVPVPGMSQDDYAKQMQQKAAGMGRSGSPGGMPPGAPVGPGMAPGGAPGAPGAPPGPPR